MVTPIIQTHSELPATHGWVLLAYDMPRQPSANRVRIWRRLKRLEAELLHGALWVLPATSRNVEDFKWLAAEINDAGGHASSWLATSLRPAQERTLRGLFGRRVQDGYREILLRLAENLQPLGELIRQYRALKVRDYFGDPLGDEVRQALSQARGRIDQSNDSQGGARA